MSLDIFFLLAGLFLCFLVLLFWDLFLFWKESKGKERKDRNRDS